MTTKPLTLLDARVAIERAAEATYQAHRVLGRVNFSSAEVKVKREAGETIYDRLESISLELYGMVDALRPLRANEDDCEEAEDE